jgi:hypothetical protein
MLQQGAVCSTAGMVGARQHMQNARLSVFLLGRCLQQACHALRLPPTETTPAARTATACCLHRDVAAATTSPPAAKLLAHHSLLLLKHPVAAAPAAAATISKRGVEAAGRPPAHSLLCTHYSWHHS